GSASITVHALSEYRAKTQVVMGSVSLGGLSGAFSDAEVTSGAYTQASVGQFATLSSSGAVEVLADLKTANTFYPDNTPDRLLGKNGTTPAARHEAIGLTDSIAGGAFAAAGLFASRAVVNGAVRAQLDGSVTGSSSVTAKAIGGSFADSRTLAISASGLAAMGGSMQLAEVGSGADVEAKSADTNDDQQITSSGKVEFTAQSTNSAFVHTDVASGGGIAGISVSIPTAEVMSDTTASLEGNVTAGSAGITVQSTSANTAKIEVFALSFGAFGGVAVTWGKAEITSDADTEAKVLQHASFSAPAGAVQVLATSIDHVNSQAKSIAAGALAVNVLKSEANVAGGTLASFDGDIPNTFTKTSSLTVRARGQNQATVDAFITQISLVGGGVNLASAQVTSDAQV